MQNGENTRNEQDQLNPGDPCVAAIHSYSAPCAMIPVQNNEDTRNEQDISLNPGDPCVAAMQSFALLTSGSGPAKQQTQWIHWVLGVVHSKGYGHTIIVQRKRGWPVFTISSRDVRPLPMMGDRYLHATTMHQALDNVLPVKDLVRIVCVYANSWDYYVGDMVAAADFTERCYRCRIVQISTMGDMYLHSTGCEAYSDEWVWAEQRDRRVVPLVFDPNATLPDTIIQYPRLPPHPFDIPSRILS